MPPTLDITLLGGFRLAIGDEPVRGAAARARLQALLGFLILHRDAPQPRRRIAFLFWPDTTESQALTNLRRELHHLRRALPDSDRHLSVAPGTLQWRADSPSRIDVAEFEAAMAAGEAANEAGDARAERRSLERAVALYRGELLPNCYDAWIEGERERIRRAADRALERLIDACERDGDGDGAIRAAERLVSRDPLREASHARLIALHAAAGDRAAALRAYDFCARTLTRELGVEPGQATRAAREMAMSAGSRPLTAAPSIPTSGQEATLEAPPPVMSDEWSVPETPPLVGRDRERAAIRDWMDKAERGHGPGRSRILLLRGEPGIGKTRLLDELADGLRRAGGRVIRGRGFEAETVRPYGAWIDALRSVPREWVAGSPELAFLLPEIRGSANAPSDRSRLFDAVTRWLTRLAGRGGPVGVLIDDIQWLDEASAALLHYIARLRSDTPILVACAARPAEVESNGPVSGFLRGLERARAVRPIDLGPVGRDQVAALARFVDPSIDPDRVFADSGGNPLFALEVAHALVQDDGGSGTIDELIGSRLARLDEPARELLSWAAALGRGFDPSTAARVSETPLPELLPALERLERHGILRPGESPGSASYDFSHDIVRRAAYAALSGPRRRLVHLRIARALQEESDPEGVLAGDVAHHAWLGGDPNLAASAAVTAGHRCLRISAHAEARELVRRGIAYTRELEETERVRLHLALLRVEIAAGVRPPGRVAEVEDELRTLIADARGLGSVDEEATGHSLLSVLHYDRENFARVHQSSIEAADALRDVEGGGSMDLHATARTLGQTGACLASIERDMRRAELVLREAETLAARAGLEVIDVPMGLGMVRYFHGDHHEAVRLLGRGLRMARAERDHFRSCACLTALVELELDRHAPERAHAYCRELLPVAAKMKEGSEMPFSRALDALARYVLAGDRAADSDAADDLARCLERLRRMNTARKIAHIQVHAGEADLDAGRIDTAFDRAEEALEAARIVDHRSGIAVAGALLVRSARARSDTGRARHVLRVLQRELDDGPDGRELSARAREAVAELVDVTGVGAVDVAARP